MDQSDPVDQVPPARFFHESPHDGPFAPAARAGSAVAAEAVTSNSAATAAATNIGLRSLIISIPLHPRCE